MERTTQTISALIAGAALATAGAAHAQTVLIDFGPGDDATGTNQTGDNNDNALVPDSNGNLWNNVQVGEFVRLQDTTGGTGGSFPTGPGIGIGPVTGLSGGSNGPVATDTQALGDLAISTATQDYHNTAGGILVYEFSAMWDEETYRFRIFGSREESGVEQTTNYTIFGGQRQLFNVTGEQSASVTTGGPGIGSDGGDANFDQVITFSGVQ